MAGNLIAYSPSIFSIAVSMRSILIAENDRRWMAVWTRAHNFCSTRTVHNHTSLADTLFISTSSVFTAANMFLAKYKLCLPWAKNFTNSLSFFSTDISNNKTKHKMSYMIHTSVLCGTKIYTLDYMQINRPLFLQWRLRYIRYACWRHWQGVVVHFAAQYFFVFLSYIATWKYSTCNALHTFRWRLCMSNQHFVSNVSDCMCSCSYIPDSSQK